MKRKQKLVSDTIVEELIKRATERAARDLGMSIRDVSAPSQANLCSAAKLRYNKLKAAADAVHPTHLGSDNQLADLIDAGIAVQLHCGVD